MGKMVHVIALGVIDADVFEDAKDKGIFARELDDDGLFWSSSSGHDDPKQVAMELFDDELVINTAIPFLRECLRKSLE